MKRLKAVGGPAVLPFDRIYFDTESLLGAGWPRGSAELSNLFSLSKSYGVELFLPEPVKLEMTSHFLREREKRRAAFEKAAASLDTSIFDPPQFHLQEFDVDRERCEASIKTAMETLGLVASPVTARPVAEFFEAAAESRPPFWADGGGEERKEKSFKDHVILMSVIDHLTPGTRAAFVSKDRVFEAAAKSGFMKLHGRSLLIFPDVREALKKMEARLDSARRKKLAQEKAAAKVALESHASEIHEFVNKNLVIDPEKLSTWPRIVAIREITFGGISEVETTFQPGLGKEAEGVRISFELRADLSVSREVPMTLPKAKRLRIGEPEGPRLSDLLGGYIVTGSSLAAPRTETVPIEVPIECEAVATRAQDGYTDLKITSCKLKDSQYPYAHLQKLMDDYLKKAADPGESVE